MNDLIRVDGRKFDQLREIEFILDYTSNPLGSCLTKFGNTWVLATVSIKDKVPAWMKGQGNGWLTAEYQMIPGASSERIEREATKGKVSGRTHEISRLIGRSLRSIVDLSELGEVTLSIDCEVLQADGGTRTASITGAYLALQRALKHGKEQGLIPKLFALKDSISAISVGIYQNQPILDLNYHEDSSAQTDMNIIQLGSGNYIELQGTAEESSFSSQELVELLKLGNKGNSELKKLQHQVLSS